MMLEGKRELSGSWVRLTELGLPHTIHPLFDLYHGNDTSKFPSV
jgi:hypothetical protein